MVDLPLLIWILAFLTTFVAGFVKGVVGFAMPMIMISGLGTFMPPEIALAGLIVPTMVSNLWQAMRKGVSKALDAMRAHWRYLLIVLVLIAFSAQLVRILPDAAMFLLLGTPVTFFALSQLVGWRLRITPERRLGAEVATAIVAGFIGGISGVWGPPTVAYLTALNTEKTHQVLVQGVVYGLGAVVLFVSHLNSGIMNAETVPFSALLLIPALLGMALGFQIHDRLDQTLFRRATLIVLVVAGLNLIRRGLMS